MKKEYISPAVEHIQIRTESLMTTISGGGDKGDDWSGEGKEDDFDVWYDDLSLDWEV